MLCVCVCECVCVRVFVLGLICWQWVNMWLLISTISPQYLEVESEGKSWKHKIGCIKASTRVPSFNWYDMWCFIPIKIHCISIPVTASFLNMQMENTSPASFLILSLSSYQISWGSCQFKLSWFPSIAVFSCTSKRNCATQNVNQKPSKKHLAKK